ncbi:MAG: hypothetical protein QOE68_2640 [Thermoanaerobaculia bacterium]|jgi:2-methylcitrate dehydratase PrpD|nr:hypothetical protein [Thermoanaerobaculia bacterium]
MGSDSGVSPLMEQVSRYVAETLVRPLPAEVIEKAKHHLLDTVAAMLSGATLAPGKSAISYVSTLGGTPEACVAGTRIVTSIANAAFANGMLAHADETDDSHQPGFCHPGCAVIPAALAMGERERRSGADFLRAIVAGYDIGPRITMALGGMHFHNSGHATHSFAGIFGAAVAAGVLAGLDATGIRYVLSYAAQQASGVSCWMRDSDHIEKAFDFGGMPAQHGVAAAAMVAHGFTGLADVFSGDRNFFEAFGVSDPQRLVEGLGERYEIAHSNIKKWPVGSPIQAALDSVETLMRENKNLSAGDVDHINVHIQDHEAAVVDDREMPDISLQHMVALLLVDGHVGFESSHDMARLDDPAVASLRERVKLTPSPELTTQGGRRAIVEIYRRDSATPLRTVSSAVRGTADNPMSREEVVEKADDLITLVLGAQRARDVIDCFMNIEEVGDMRDVRPVLQA